MEVPSTEEIDTKECPDSNELLRKIRARYATCSSYSDKGEFTKKVGRSGYSETFPFRTHFVRPGQVYLKFRDQDNTTILRSKRKKVIFLCQEDRDERKVFVPFRKYDSLEGALVNCFHHELFPTFILLLLNLDSFNEHKGVLD